MALSAEKRKEIEDYLASIDRDWRSSSRVKVLDVHKMNEIFKSFNPSKQHPLSGSGYAPEAISLQDVDPEDRLLYLSCLYTYLQRSNSDAWIQSFLVSQISPTLMEVMDAVGMVYSRVDHNFTYKGDEIAIIEVAHLFFQPWYKSLFQIFASNKVRRRIARFKIFGR